MYNCVYTNRRGTDIALVLYTLFFTNMESVSKDCLCQPELSVGNVKFNCYLVLIATQRHVTVLYILLKIIITIS